MLGRSLQQFAIFTFEAGLKRRNTFRYWRQLEQSQWLPPSELAQMQGQALRRLVSHAWEFCPYYREQWSALGLQPASLQSVEDIRRWPLLDRPTIRRNRQRMRSTASGTRLLPKVTGGSSGVPLQFDVTPDSNDRRMAAWHRGYAWAGAEPGTKQLYLWGVPLGNPSPWRRWKDFAYQRLLYRRQVLNSFELSTERVPQFLAEYNRFRPEVVVAYTNPLYEFACALKRKQVRPFSPRAIVVGAEKLHPWQRALIEEVFQSPLFETYGAREFMLMGAECDRHEGLHLTAEHLLLEIVEDDGQPTPPGEEGNVVVTDLYNYGMPFVRYLNGDRAIAGSDNCACGRTLPLLKRVVGRRLDILTTPGGGRIPGEFFPHLLKDYAAIERFQVVQEKPDAIRLRIVADHQWDDSEQRRLETEALQVIGAQTRFIVERVEEIPLSSAGKLQVVVNNCISADGPPVA